MKRGEWKNIIARDVELMEAGNIFRPYVFKFALWKWMTPSALQGAGQLTYQVKAISAS
jgi:hypothetical protein